MNIYRSASQLVGHTPLLQPVRYMEQLRLPATVLVKLESFNPAGSVKDRVALEMIEDAEKEGKLLPGGTIVEPTSGNTGIGLAAMGLARGYQVILTMPESMSLERRQLLAAYGAQLVLTPAKGGMAGAVEKAKELAAAIPGSFLAGQFDNPANPRAHYRTTGPEIWHDTDGQVDIFVAGVGQVGRDLLEQIRLQRRTLMADNGLQIRVVGIANSRKRLIDAEGIALNDCLRRLEEEGTPSTPESLRDEILALNIYNTFYGQNVNSRGTAQAKAVLFFLLVAAIGLIQLRATRKKEVQQ